MFCGHLCSVNHHGVALVGGWVVIYSWIGVLLCKHYSWFIMVLCRSVLCESSSGWAGGGAQLWAVGAAL
jgi:hypothetical protein